MRRDHHFGHPCTSVLSTRSQILGLTPHGSNADRNVGANAGLDFFQALATQRTGRCRGHFHWSSGCIDGKFGRWKSRGCEFIYPSNWPLYFPGSPSHLLSLRRNWKELLKHARTCSALSSGPTSRTMRKKIASTESLKTTCQQE